MAEDWGLSTALELPREWYQGANVAPEYQSPTPGLDAYLSTPLVRPSLSSWGDLGTGLGQLSSLAMPGLSRLLGRFAPSLANGITAYHGEGGAGAAGSGGRWWTTNPQRAASYGGRVSQAEIPDALYAEAQALARKLGSGTPGDAVLGPEWLRKAVPYAVKPQVWDLGP